MIRSWPSKIWSSAFTALAEARRQALVEEQRVPAGIWMKLVSVDGREVCGREVEVLAFPIASEILPAFEDSPVLVDQARAAECP